MLAKVDDYVTERRNIETGPFGTLRVLAESDYAQHVLSSLTTKFGKSRPGLRVHVSAVSSHALAVEDGFDVIVSQQKPPVPGLVVLDLGTIRHVICASPAYLKKFGRPKVPQDLREHNCLADQYGGPKTWPFQNSARPLHVEVKGSLSSDSNDVLIQMALQGYGIVRVPLYAVKAALAAKRLEILLKNLSLSPERMGVYYAKGKRLPAKTAEFIAFLKESVGEP